eukprot:TRINITY_DN30792_c0_g1_i2.p1 TRINITY_DN30792_c0_g1~~TRINITY_DN30792_c0_g1_i2.p1  ORF type:complete len:177 (+),score=33.10 TRINITY_DN30792_c0_g1_i2:91-621(+)
MAAKRQRAGEGGAPAKVFKAGAVLAPELAEEVASFAGGLLEHLGALRDAALPKVVAEEVAQFRKLVQEADPSEGHSVIVHRFTRDHDEVNGIDKIGSLLVEALPDAIIGHWAFFNTVVWWIVDLRVDMLALECIAQMRKQANRAYSSFCMRIEIKGLPGIPRRDHVVPPPPEPRPG